MAEYKCPIVPLRNAQEAEYKSGILLKKFILLPVLDLLLETGVDIMDKAMSTMDIAAKIGESIDNVIGSVTNDQWAMYAIDKNIKETISNLSSEIGQLSSLLGLIEKLRGLSSDGRKEDLDKELLDLSEDLWDIIGSTRVDIGIIDELSGEDLIYAFRGESNNGL